MKNGLLLTIRNGFSPYILLRLARFFFYCQNIIQIFPAIFSMVNQKPGMEDIVSYKRIFFIDREGPLVRRLSRKRKRYHFLLICAKKRICRIKQNSHSRKILSQSKNL